MVENLSKAEKEILLHTLGLNYGPFHSRNFFGTSGEPDLAVCRGLVERGFMEERPAPSFMQKDERVFLATNEGKRVANTAYQASLPKLTRSQRRYRAYLECDSSLSFFEWLLEPYYDDLRKRRNA